MTLNREKTNLAPPTAAASYDLNSSILVAELELPPAAADEPVPVAAGAGAAEIATTHPQ